jgi:hypothetical protein
MTHEKLHDKKNNLRSTLGNYLRQHNSEIYNQENYMIHNPLRPGVIQVRLLDKELVVLGT